MTECQCRYLRPARYDDVLRIRTRVAELRRRTVRFAFEILRDPSHTLSVRLTEFLRMFDEEGLEILRQSLRRRPRSFNNWMLRGGHAPGTKKYVETRKLMEQSMAGDRSGFSAQAQGDDIQIIHNEGMFLVTRKIVTQ